QTVNVTAKDAFGNIKTDYAGTIHFATTSTLFTLPGNYTFTVGTGNDNGAHSFASGVKLNTAGTQSVTINDVAVTTVKGSQAGLVITPGAATTLTVVGFPTTIAAGVTKSFTVTAKDAFGNVAVGYTGTVQFGTNADPGSVTLPANYTFTGGDAGKHVFSATFTTAEGGRILQAVDA